MTTTPHGRGERVRKPALAALSVVATVGAPALAPASADAQGPALNAAMRHHALVGSKVPVKGTLAGPAGQRVLVQQAKGRGWKTVARTKTRAGGGFATSFRPKSLGRTNVRVVGPGGAVDSAKVTAYRSVQASWYGPGFYGHHLACGGSYKPSQVGVANKSLPCGTKVTLRYKGRTVVAPVIDRGPFAGNRVYDLTAATKAKLGFGSTGSVWSSK